MQYEATSPQGYLDALPNDWRNNTLQALRHMILQANPGITESINYKMLCYALDRRVIFHLNAQKNYVSLYCGDIKQIDPNAELLDGLNIGKGCIRFTKTKSIPDTHIDKFIDRAILLTQSGVDLSC